MARLLADENFPLPVVRALRKLGHDVVTLQEAGYGDQAIPDEQVLLLAAADLHALLTLNRKHFVRLHNEAQAHAGILVCRFDPDFEQQARSIHAEISSRSGLSGELIRVNRPQTSQIPPA